MFVFSIYHCKKKKWHEGLGMPLGIDDVHDDLDRFRKNAMLVR